MSGQSIPYHLRQNKVVDRYAFIELLSRIDRFKDISSYSYIGFGGHSLEDFKYIHSRFGIIDMISLEKNEDVYKRQKFNQPHSCINRIHQDSSDFIDKFSRNKQTIIWLDYTDPSSIRSQIEEFQATINKLEPLDVLKITLNANAASYKEAAKGATPQAIQQSRLEELRIRLGNIFPYADVTEAFMTAKKFPEALCLILRHAANLAMQTQHDLIFQPLASFSYADGQTMLTVTGIILENSQVDDFFSGTDLKSWELVNTDWGKPRSIDIPDLTIRERLYIDQLLPDSNEQDIQDGLGFLFGKHEHQSLEMLKNYIIFYRQSPYFSRIFV
jgi:hypothetical protein